VKFDMKDVSVCLAMPAHRDIPTDTVASLLETQGLLRDRNIPFEVLLTSGSSIIEAARSKTTHLFLKSDKSRIFWVDSDIVWKAESFVRLLALSTKVDVVIGAYPTKKDPIQFFVNTAGQELVESNELGLLPNVGTGLGFACIRRHVIEKLADKAPKLRFNDANEKIAHIFRCDSEGGDFRGEDIAFWSDIRAMGITVYLDPTLELGHHGSKTFTASLSNHLVKAGD
jgi:hypothetical protein